MLDLKHFKTVLTEIKAALKPIDNAYKNGGIPSEDFTEATRHIIKIFRMTVESDLSGAYFLMDTSPGNEDFKIFVYDDPYILELNANSLNGSQTYSDDARYVRVNFFKFKELNGNGWFNPTHYEITEKNTLIFHSEPQKI